MQWVCFLKCVFKITEFGDKGKYSGTSNEKGSEIKLWRSDDSGVYLLILHSKCTLCILFVKFNSVIKDMRDRQEMRSLAVRRRCIKTEPPS